jgi:hypothetical protein
MNTKTRGTTSLPAPARMFLATARHCRTVPVGEFSKKPKLFMALISWQGCILIVSHNCYLPDLTLPLRKDRTSIAFTSAMMKCSLLPNFMPRQNGVAGLAGHINRVPTASAFGNHGAHP